MEGFKQLVSAKNNSRSRNLPPIQGAGDIPMTTRAPLPSISKTLDTNPLPEIPASQSINSPRDQLNTQTSETSGNSPATLPPLAPSAPPPSFEEVTRNRQLTTSSTPSSSVNPPSTTLFQAGTSRVVRDSNTSSTINVAREVSTMSRFYKM